MGFETAKSEGAGSLRGSQLDGLVAASDVRHEDLALLIVLRAGVTAVETHKKPAAAGGEQSGLVQCQM